MIILEINGGCSRKVLGACRHFLLLVVRKWRVDSYFISCSFGSTSTLDTASQALNLIIGGLLVS